MISRLPSPSSVDDPESTARRGEIEEEARRLHALAAEAGAGRRLTGRHVAIAGVDHDSPQARLFERAAVELGARVSHLGQTALDLDGAEGGLASARLLGTLYDAIDGLGLDGARAGQMQRLIGVPVFADLGGAACPLRRLLRRPDDAEELLVLVQASLVEAIG